MNSPQASVVIETITARSGGRSASLADELQWPLGGLARQTYPAQQFETIVVLDAEVSADEVTELRRRYPQVRFEFSAESNYFAAKNAGAAAAATEIIALLDSDCQPCPHWLASLIPLIASGADAVAGRARYEGSSFTARTFSVPDLAYVIGRENGDASGFNINNAAFRRDVLLAYPFDERIRRNGGCYLLYHQLRAAGMRIVYEPRAVTAHRLDFRGFGFVRKHFDRGYDGVGVYRLDDRAVLKGTRFFRRAGALGLVPIYVRRTVIDWLHMLRHRRQIGIAAVALPYFAVVDLMTRLIEFSGAFAAAIAPRTSR